MRSVRINEYNTATEEQKRGNGMGKRNNKLYLEGTTIRDIDADIMRVLSCFFVVLIHVSTYGDGDFSLALNCISRFSVPVFVMISGRYMLEKRMEWKHLAKKSIHLLFLMLFWSTIFYFYSCWLGQQPESYLSFILTQPVHLWYIWAIIALYLMVPFLYVFCEHASQSIYRYELGFTFLTGTVITLLLRTNLFPVFSEVIEKTKLPYQLGFVFCFLFGDYFRRYRPKISLFGGVILFGAGTLGTVWGTFVLRDTPLDGLLLSFFSPFAIIAAIGLYSTVSQIGYHKLWGRSFLHKAAKCTLGIYLMHPLLIRPVAYSIKNLFDTSAEVFTPMCTLVVFALSFIVVFMIRKIPLFKVVFG